MLLFCHSLYWKRVSPSTVGGMVVQAQWPASFHFRTTNTKAQWGDKEAWWREERKRESLTLVIKRMKSGKAVTLDGVPVKVWRALREKRTEIVWDLKSNVYEEYNLPEIWKVSSSDH